MTNKEKLQEALNKKGLYGNDIDLNEYDDNNDVHIKNQDEFSEAGKARLEHVGIELDGSNRSASFIQVDNAPIQSAVNAQTPLELMNTGAAAKKYPELVEKYWWKAVSADTDKYTAKTATEEANGYFIRVKAGEKIKYPLQACVFLSHEQQLQRVHNIVIVEDGAELNIISGCASDPSVDKAIHLGISEFYVGKNAKLTFTMIHSWGENVAVRPRSVTIIEEGGQFISNYVCMEKVKDVQMNPVTRLVGEGAVARLNSILVAPKGSHLDIGGKAILEVPGTRAELVTRTISTGGEVINRGTLSGHAEGVRAHLECHGLMLSNEGYISAIPQLDAYTGNAEMSHEAAVGRIAPEEIEYLMARGLDEDEATATIVRGFLNVNIEGLPESLAKKIADTLDTFSLNKGA